MKLSSTEVDATHIVPRNIFIFILSTTSITEIIIEGFISNNNQPQSEGRNSVSFLLLANPSTELNLTRKWRNEEKILLLLHGTSLSLCLN
jgi:hypothetical protein